MSIEDIDVEKYKCKGIRIPINPKNLTKKEKPIEIYIEDFEEPSKDT